MPPTMKKPVLLFFREVLPDDLDKYETKSAVAKTGGGARDLRFPKGFGPKIGSMFPTKTKRPGVMSGTINWEDSKGRREYKSIELWPPTNARPGEMRIGRFYEVDSWKVDAVEFEKARQQGQKWFFLLVKDSEGNVWARLLEERNLDGEWEIVRNFIKRRIQDTQGKRAVCGLIDFEKDEVFPE